MKHPFQRLNFIAWGLLASAAHAQEVAAGAVEPVAQSMTLIEIIQTGGWLMYVLGAMSVLGLALILYFAFALRRTLIVPPDLIANVKSLIREGRWVEAHTACRNNSSAMASILSAAFDYVLRTPKPDPGLLREIVEGEGGRQASALQNQTQYLMDIAAVSPMVGLLGTVLGMLRAFNTVALDLAKAKPMLLAAGVSQALVTTVAGLIVAIPAMIAYAYFRGRVSRLISDMEAHAADVVAMLHKE